MDLRDRFPLTLAFLGDLPAGSTLHEIVEAVCAANAKGDIPHRAIRDLVRFEAALAEIPQRLPPIDALPRDDEPCMLAPHARIIVYGAALPEMLAALREGKPAKARPSRGWIVLVPGREIILERMSGWMLESFREAQKPADAIEDDEDREQFHEFWRAGILARAGAG